MRKEFPDKVRALAFRRAKGHCESCTRKLFAGDIHYDHANPDALGGAPTLENCAVLCRSCHRTKTSQKDIPAIAKSNRVRLRNIGIKARTSRPMPGSKASPWRKRMDGTVERRDGRYMRPQSEEDEDGPKRRNGAPDPRRPNRGHA